MSTPHPSHALSMLESLSSELARMEYAFDALPVAVYEADASDRIVFANAAFRAFLGVEDPTGTAVADYYTDPSRRRDVIARAEREDGITLAIIALRNGSHAEERLRVHAQGGQRCVTGTLTDVTEAVTYERELDRVARKLDGANTELERRVSALNTFAYAVSHDLKTPLRGLLAYLRAFDEDVDAAGVTLPSRVRDHIGKARAAGLGMERMIQGLLEFTRAQTETTTGKADASQALDEILRLHAHMLADQGVELSVETLPEVPVAPAAFRTVLGNLVGNAIAHADRAEGRVRVRVAENPDGWTFSVEDDGPGVPPELRDRIFQLFYRSGTPKTGSTGVGLAIARTTVENWGGRLWVDDAPEGGAAFRFTVPRARATGPATEASRAQRDTRLRS